MSNGRAVLAAAALITCLGLVLVVYTRPADSSVSPRAVASVALESEEQHTVFDYLGLERFAVLKGLDTMPLVGVASLSVNNDDKLLAADRGDFNVKMFDIRSGGLTEVLGDRGGSDGQFLHLAAATLVDDSTIVVADDSRLRLIFYSLDGRHEKDVPMRLRPVSSIASTDDYIIVAGGLIEETSTGPSVSKVGLRFYDKDGRIEDRLSLEPPLVKGKSATIAPPGSRLPLIAGPMIDGRLVVAWRLADQVALMSIDDGYTTTLSLPTTPFFDQSNSQTTASLVPVVGSPVVLLAATDSLVAVGYFPTFGDDQRLRYHLITLDGKVLGSDLLGPMIWGTHDGSFLTLEQDSGQAALSGLRPKY